MLAQSSGNETAAVFIDVQLALTDVELDALANELVAAGDTQAQASLDGAIASEVLSVDELNALYDLNI